jgi:hypothetical protein
VRRSDPRGSERPVPVRKRRPQLVHSDSGAMSTSTSASTRSFDVDPLDPLGAADRIDHRVQAVADNTIDTLDASLEQDFYQLVGERRATHLHLSFVEVRGCAQVRLAGERRFGAQARK